MLAQCSIPGSVERESAPGLCLLPKQSACGVGRGGKPLAAPPGPHPPPPCRGNSKYHYYGLRIKASSPLLRLMEDQQHMAMRGQPFSQKQRWERSAGPRAGRWGGPCCPAPTHMPCLPFFSRLKPIQKMEGMTNGVAVGPQPASGLSDISAQVQQYQQFLGEGSPAHRGVGQGLWAQRVGDGSPALPEPCQPPLHWGLLLGGRVATVRWDPRERLEGAAG